MAPSAGKLMLTRRRQASASPSPQPPSKPPQGPQPQQSSPVSQVQAYGQKWFSEKWSIFRQRSQAVKQANESKTLEKRVPDIVELCNC